MTVRPSAMMRDFSKPQFGSQKDDRGDLKKFVALSVIVLVFFLAGSGLFIFSPWFYIKGTNITGLEFIQESQVQLAIQNTLAGKRYGIIPMRSRFFVDTQEIQTQLEKSFAFSSVTVGKRGANLQVDVRERPSGIFVTDGVHPVFADLDGIVVRDAEESEKELVGNSETSLPFLLLFIESTIDAKPGERLFPEGFLAHYQSLQLHLEVETGLVVRQYVLPRPNATWMKAKLADNREIYFDMTRDVQPQIDKLLALLRTKGEELKTVSYIDLRYTDRVYYK